MCVCVFASVLFSSFRDFKTVELCLSSDFISVNCEKIQPFPAFSIARSALDKAHGETWKTLFWNTFDFKQMNGEQAHKIRVVFLCVKQCQQK